MMRRRHCDKETWQQGDTAIRQHGPKLSLASVSSPLGNSEDSPQTPKMTHPFTQRKTIQQMLVNRRKIRSGTQNWSVDVFLRVSNEVVTKTLFQENFGIFRFFQHILKILVKK